jgi:hypothetical protein
MKLFQTILCAGLLAIGAAGCKSGALTNTYNTEAAIDASVTAAWSLWLAYEKAAPQPATVVAQVDAAFQKVQAAEEAALAISAAAASSSTNNGVAVAPDLTAVNAAVQSLSNLLLAFKIKL